MVSDKELLRLARKAMKRKAMSFPGQVDHVCVSGDARKDPRPTVSTGTIEHFSVEAFGPRAREAVHAALIVLAGEDK